MSEQHRQWRVMVEFEPHQPPRTARWWWQVESMEDPGWPRTIGGGWTATLSAAMDEIDTAIDVDLEHVEP